MNTNNRYYALHQPMKNIKANSKFMNLFLSVSGKLIKKYDRPHQRWTINPVAELELRLSMLQELETKISKYKDHGWQPFGECIVSNKKHSDFHNRR